MGRGHRAGWTLTERLTLLGLAAMSALGVIGLVQTHGGLATAKMLALGAAVLVPLVAALVWWAERRHRRLQARVRSGEP